VEATNTLARDTRWITALTSGSAPQNVVPDGFRQHGDALDQFVFDAKLLQRLAQVLHDGIKVAVVESLFHKVCMPVPQNSVSSSSWTISSAKRALTASIPMNQGFSARAAIAREKSERADEGVERPSS
jgi:hypothetical protein